MIHSPLDSAIARRFMAIVDRDPSRVLVYLPAVDTVITAGQLAAMAAQCRESLLTLGVAPGALVIGAGGNRIGSMALLLACRMIGAPLMPMDGSATTSEIDDAAVRYGAQIIVRPVGAGIVSMSDSARLDAELVATRREVALAPDYGDAAVLKLTSGSTGLPKATLTTEVHLLQDTSSVVAAMGIAPGDVQIAAIPLSHAYGLGNLVMPLFTQGTAMVLRESFVPQQLGPDARRYGARVFPGVPFMFQHFVNEAPVDGWPPTLQLLMSAGARLPAPTAQAFAARFGVKIHTFYGASETGGIAYDGSSGTSAGDAVGRPMPGVVVRLVSDASAPEGCGRVHVSGPAVAERYVGEASAEDGFVAGGFLTGDFGRLDATGALTLTGRVSSFVNVAGRKVQPGEVERVLRNMPQVQDVRVVAAPDDRRGQQIVACLVVSTPVTTLQVRQFCSARLAAYKVPRAVMCLDRWPLTERGKIDHRLLLALVHERLGLAPPFSRV